MHRLEDTIAPMMSGNYQDRMRAEYWQLKVRQEKLAAMIEKHEAGVLPFTPSCPIDLLKEQAGVMLRYLQLLEERAEMENVNLHIRKTEGDYLDIAGTKEDPNLAAFWAKLRKTVQEIKKMDVPEAVHITAAFAMMMKILETVAETCGTVVGEALKEEDVHDNEAGDQVAAAAAGEV